jgi:hypothetical protein
MQRFFRNNGLSLVLFVLFLATLAGQSLTGYAVELQELQTHDQPPISFISYLRSGEFLEVTMENWESEFFQMFVYVVFTIFLFQKGSAESKDPEKSDEVDRDPRGATERRDAPAPVKRGAWMLKLYEHSLSLAFLVMFLISFALHGVGGVRAHNEQLIQHGDPPISLAHYFVTSQFWFESLQNWQSEFLAIWCMVVLTIFLRQRGSPESKPVDAPHSQTGSG